MYGIGTGLLPDVSLSPEEGFVDSNLIAIVALIVIAVPGLTAAYADWSAKEELRKESPKKPDYREVVRWRCVEAGALVLFIFGMAGTGWWLTWINWFTPVTWVFTAVVFGAGSLYGVYVLRKVLRLLWPADPRGLSSRIQDEPRVFQPNGGR